MSMQQHNNIGHLYTFFSKQRSFRFNLNFIKAASRRVEWWESIPFNRSLLWRYSLLTLSGALVLKTAASGVVLPSFLLQMLPCTLLLRWLSTSLHKLLLALWPATEEPWLCSSRDSKLFSCSCIVGSVELNMGQPCIKLSVRIIMKRGTWGKMTPFPQPSWLGTPDRW